MNISPTNRTTEEIEKIITRLYALPATALPVVVEFIGFLEARATEMNYISRPQSNGYTQLPKGSTEAQYLHPTVGVSAEKFLLLVGILPGIESDALADTEALYDGD